jgi:Ca-activated chloride channel family protein
VEQEFVNENDWEVEGTYIFPIPAGASISRFVMWVDGEPLEGEILPADQAKEIYEEIVRQRKDPALLEYIGQGAVQARIYPIPAGGSRKIELEYSQVLEIEEGMIRYLYPLNTEKFSFRPLENCSVRVELESKQPFRSLYSPTHQDRIFVQRDGENRAIVSYEENDVLPDQDFELIYTTSRDDVGLNLLVYPEWGEDGFQSGEGFFLLMAAPAFQVDRVVPRDIVLVLDTSGSMEGDKLHQAKGAAKYVLGQLNPEDRFNIIAFSSGIRHFAAGMQSPFLEGEAFDWIDRLEALGGTNINLALMEAAALGGNEDSTRPLVFLFLTDGLPTEGVTEIDQIIANVGSSNSQNLRLFAFGVGDDVNTELLDTLADENMGLVRYVRPGERIDEEVSSLFARIKAPVLTDLDLEVDGVQVEEFYPPVLPDLYAGTQLILTGRYRVPGYSSGRAEVNLSGQVGGERKAYSYQVDFNPGSSQYQHNDYVPRLWATRKIGYLLNQIRYQGENQEWVDAIIQLSIRYGIITPYTSFLVEEHDLLAREGYDEAAEELLQEYSGPAVGAEAVGKADAEANLRSAESVSGSVYSGSGEEASMDEPILVYVEGKTFLYREGVWVDSTYQPGLMDVVEIGFGSQAYFELLAARPLWGKYLALGEQVIFVGEGRVFQIVAGEEGVSEIPSGLISEEQSPEIVGEESPNQVLGKLNSLCAGPVVAALAVTLWVRKK